MHSTNELPASIVNTDCIIDNVQSQPFLMVTKTVNRPQSPRQFFEKLYGHLETTPSTTTNTCKEKQLDRHYSPIRLSPRHSELSSSPDISDSRTRASSATPLMDDIHHMDYQHTNAVFSNGVEAPSHHPFLSPPFTQFRPMIGMPQDYQFPAGLGAFLARRRRKEGRPRRQRTTFSSDQTFKLEVEFHRNEYISRSRRFELAENLCLSETQIKIWFQNRRAKDKRIEKAQIDHQYRSFAMANGFMSSMQYSHMRPAISFLSTTGTTTDAADAAQLLDSVQHNTLVDVGATENSLKMHHYNHQSPGKPKSEHLQNHYFKENTTC